MLNVKVLFLLTSLLTIGFGLWRSILSPEGRHLLPLRFGLVILLPAIGMLTPNIWLYYGAVVAMMLFLPRSRVEAVGLFLLIALTLPPASTGLMAGGTYLLKVDTLRFASLSLLAALRFPGRAPRSSADAGLRFDVLFGMFFLLMFVMSARSGEAISVTFLLRTLLENVFPFGIPFFMITRSFREPTDQRSITAYFIMAGFLLAVIATFEMLRHWPLYTAIDAHLGTGGKMSKTLAVRGGLMRSPGPYFESTTFGVVLALMTIATASMRSIFRSTGTHQFAIFVGCCGAFATLARNGWIGLVLGLILLGLYKGRAARTIVIAVAAVAVFAAFAIVVPKSGTFGALTGQSGHAASTSDYRERLFTASIPAFKSSPLIGTQASQLGSKLEDLKSGGLEVDFVNSYIYFALASGGIGLIIFVMFLFTPIVSLWNVRRYQQKLYGNEAAGAVFACLGALSMMVAFTSFAERIPMLTVILVALARNAYVNSRIARSRQSRSAG